MGLDRGLDRAHLGHEREGLGGASAVRVAAYEGHVGGLGEGDAVRHQVVEDLLQGERGSGEREREGVGPCTRYDK